MMGGTGGFGAMGGFGGFGGMGLGLLVTIAVIILVLWGASLLVAPRTTTADGETSSLEILRRRYARGEISQAEYEQARRALR